MVEKDGRDSFLMMITQSCGVLFSAVISTQPMISRLSPTATSLWFYCETIHSW